jgi:hypothetical protein
LKAKRLLKNVQVSFISLVKEGANKKQIIWKSAEGNENPTFSKDIAIAKTDEEKQMVFGIVYSPDEVDTQGDIMTAPEIEKMAYTFMKEGRTQQVDRQHDFQPDEGFIAESWIVKENDPYFSEIGSWAVGIKVEDRGTWELIKSGEITGISMAGSAETEELEKSNILTELKTVVQELSKALKLTKAEDDTLTIEQVQEAIEKAIKPLNDKIAELETANTELKKSVEELDIPEPIDLKPLEDRLEVVEKASKGKQSADGQEDPKDNDGAENIWV